MIRLDSYSRTMLSVICLALMSLFTGFTGCSTQQSDADTTDVSPTTATPEQLTPLQPKKEHPANHLVHETSPYLLLHAHNPVDWYPWGREALEKAKRENKPIFLSIGYSSCYWCHVMERLVFSNEQIANFMNEHFVNIKVDREERPDLDEIYMNSLIVFNRMTNNPQGGGWPLSMFLTPDAKPFAGGTYFPPETDLKTGRTGFPEICEKVVVHWDQQQQQILSHADQITHHVKELMKSPNLNPQITMDEALISQVTDEVISSFDPVYGGVDFSAASPNGPKFPVPIKLAFLQQEARLSQNESLKKQISQTLETISQGGIHDHLGGGFHRYSVDRQWHVPHFEKMLYDQALLAGVYLEEYKQTRNENARRTVEDILSYVLQDMTDREGAFYSALDAETDHIEGKYYVWTTEELQSLLTESEFDLVSHLYGLQEKPGHEQGFVLHLVQSYEQFAEQHRLSLSSLHTQIDSIREKLLLARSRRSSPLRDDKVLTSWNGLMIGTFARAGIILQRQEYLSAAERSARFLLTKLRTPKGRLLRSWRQGEAKLNAYVDDYAFLIHGLLNLYEATGEEQWLNASQRLMNDQITHYWDQESGGFLFTPHDHETLLAHIKNAYDAVLPSGNSMSVRNLVRLAEYTQNEQYLPYAEKTLALFLPTMQKAPRSMTNMAAALRDFLSYTGSNPVENTSQKQTLQTVEPIIPELKNSEVISSAPVNIRRSLAETPTQPSESQFDRRRTSTPALNIHPVGYQQETGTSPDTTLAQGTPPSPTIGETLTAPKKEPVVRMQAFFSTDRLPAGRTCQVIVFLKIKKGWHINANPPGNKDVIPTKLAIKSKLGTALQQVAYSKGITQFSTAFNSNIEVYENQAAIRGLISIPETAAGFADELEIAVSYQPCEAERCLLPQTIRIKGRIPVANVGQPVNAINQKYFQARGKSQGTQN